MLKMVSIGDTANQVGRFAVFSDVHGNAAAFMSVWNDIYVHGLAEGIVVNGGDTVVYGDESAESIRLIRDYPQIVSVQGNYDRHVAEFPEKADVLRRKWGTSRPDKFHAIQEASMQIDSGQREWLRDLPLEARFTMNGHRVVVCHYVPDSRKEGLNANTTQKRLEEIAGVVAADIVVVGHTHSPFVRFAHDVLFVNPGSVGRSFKSPTWALVEAKPGIAPKGDIVICPS